MNMNINILFLLIFIIKNIIKYCLRNDFVFGVSFSFSLTLLVHARIHLVYMNVNNINNIKNDNNNNINNKILNIETN